MRYFVLVTLVAACSVAAYGQPSVPAGGALNSASYAYVGLPNSGIAQGSIFVVFGTNIGPATIQRVSAFPLQKTLAGTSIQVTVNGTTVDALPLYTVSTQVAAVMPSNTPVGSGKLTLTYNGTAAPAIDVQVVEHSAGIYTLNQAGSGPGIITDANYQVFSLTSSAKPNQIVILWGTGLGAGAGDDAQPPQQIDMTDLPLKLYVGGKLADVKYRGRSGGNSGLDQINFAVPSGVLGCRVPVVVQIGDGNDAVASNFASMPIAANGGACSDPESPLSNLDLTALKNKGTVATGTLSLSRTTTTTTVPITGTQTTTTTDSGFGSFEKYDYSSFNAVQNPFGISTFGACSVYTFRGSSAGIVDPVTSTPLDAGQQITLNGPKGTKQLPQESTNKGLYSATLGSDQQGSQLYLDAGQYTFTGSGNDVQGINASLTLPEALVWSNKDSITDVQRSAGQDITWTGGDPNGTVTMTGFSMQIGTQQDGSDTVGAMFVCTAKVSDTHFTIPAPVLLSLPPSGEISSFAFPGSLSVGSSTIDSFTATGIDYGVLSSSVTAGKSVNYK